MKLLHDFSIVMVMIMMLFSAMAIAFDAGDMILPPAALACLFVFMAMATEQ